MGLLRVTRSGLGFCMGTQVLVGRGPECDLRLESRLASSPHALIRWTTEGWAVRDIGSRNGTWLGDTRLDPGKDVVLAQGALLSFGDRSERWALVHAGPPGPTATRDDGATAFASSGLLALPDPDQPSVLVLPDQDRWVVERDDDLREAHDGLILDLGGRRWTLRLPHTPVHAPLASTLDVGADDLDQVALIFSVSQDEEHVDLEILSHSARVPLSARNHHFVLLALARAREEDTRQGAAEAERGLGLSGRPVPHDRRGSGPDQPAPLPGAGADRGRGPRLRGPPRRASSAEPTGAAGTPARRGPSGVSRL